MGEGGACFEEGRETVDFVVLVMVVVVEGAAAELVAVAGDLEDAGKGGGGRGHWTVEARGAFCLSGKQISRLPYYRFISKDSNFEVFDVRSN